MSFWHAHRRPPSGSPPGSRGFAPATRSAGKQRVAPTPRRAWRLSGVTWEAVERDRVQLVWRAVQREWSPGPARLTVLLERPPGRELARSPAPAQGRVRRDQGYRAAALPKGRWGVSADLLGPVARVAARLHLRDHIERGTDKGCAYKETFLDAEDLRAVLGVAVVPLWHRADSITFRQGGEAWAVR